MKYRLAAGSAPAVVLVPILICLGTSVSWGQSCPMAEAAVSEQSARRTVQSADDSVQELMREFDQRIRQLREEMQKRLNRALADERRAVEKLREADRRIAELEAQAKRLNDIVAQLRRQMGGAAPEAAPGIQIAPARPVPTNPAAPADGERPFFGVQLGQVDEAAASRWGLDPNTGIGIITTVPRAPAALVGMQAGDVLTHVEGKAVGLEDFRRVLSTKKPGDSIAVRYARMVDGAPVNFSATVTLAKRSDFAEAGQREAVPAPAQPAPVRPAEPVPTESVKLGATVLDGGNGELEVTEVNAGSNAAVAQLQAGDFLLRMGGERVRTIEDIRNFLGSTTPGQQRAIRYRRGAERITVQMRWGAGRMAPALLSIEKTSRRGAAPARPAERRRGQLGITLDETDNGLVIAEVMPNSSAQQMGVQANDRLIEMNGAEAKTIDQLREAFGKLYAGDTITVVVMRGGIRYTLTGKLRAAAAEGGSGRNEASANDQASVPAGKPPVGIEVEERAGKLTILSVDSNSPAAVAGIEAGDRLLSLNGRKVNRLDDISSVLAGSDRSLSASVRRDGATLKIDLQLSTVGE